jgi:hypothetical protein
VNAVNLPISLDPDHPYLAPVPDSWLLANRTTSPIMPLETPLCLMLVMSLDLVDLEARSVGDAVGRVGVVLPRSVAEGFLDGDLMNVVEGGVQIQSSRVGVDPG